MMLLAGLGLLSACDPEVSRAEVVAVASGIEVRADAPIRRVAALDADGRVAVLRDVPIPAKEVWVPSATVAAGDRVWVEGTSGALTPAVWLREDVQPLQREPPVSGQVRLVSVAFPADASGQVNPAMASAKIELPSTGLDVLFRRVGLGGWANREAPTVFIGVVLANDSDAPIDIVIEDKVLDGAGRPAPAFRPRLRGATDLPMVAATLRVPPQSQATASLPVWMHRTWVEAGAYEHRLVLRTMDGVPLTERRSTFGVVRGSNFVQAGFVATACVSAIGWAWTLLRVPAWLRTVRTSDLAVIASLSAIQTLVSAVGMGLSGLVGALLGPFAPLVTGFLEEPVRIALLAVLVTRVPRPGVAALNLLVGLLLRAMVYASFGAGEWVYLGASIALTEGGLWLAGLTRETGWREASPAHQWVRFVPVAALISLGSGLAGFLVHQVFYRLYYSNLFMGAMLLGPSFLYVFLSGGWALRFARSLRRVEP